MSAPKASSRAPQIRVTASQSSSPLAGEEGARRAAVGRRGGKRDLLPLAKKMRREPTEAEARLWSVLRGKRLGGLKFKRQEQLGDYIVDFVCFGAQGIHPHRTWRRCRNARYCTHLYAP